EHEPVALPSSSSHPSLTPSIALSRARQQSSSLLIIVDRINPPPTQHHLPMIQHHRLPRRNRTLRFDEADAELVGAAACDRRGLGGVVVADLGGAGQIRRG